MSSGGAGGGGGGGGGFAGADNPTDDLFPIFFISILSVVVIPWTCSKLCCSEEKQQVSGTSKKKVEWKTKLLSKSNMTLGVLWLILIGTCLYVSLNADDTQAFDPFDILEVPKDADTKQVKSAYRRLSMKYHPDKNPDPKAAEYFSAFVSKAYKALTDEEARTNWEKYGHPDGPKSTKFGVALPSFLFNEDRHVLLLAMIVVVAIFIPLIITICYLRKSKNYTSNNMMVDTISIWAHPNSPVSVKQAHSIHRVIETFACAAEFATQKVKKKQAALLEQMMRNLVQSKAILHGEKIFKKKIEFVRVHFTLLAFLRRMAIPKELQVNTILELVPKLMAELVKVAAMPRVARLHYGWFVPTMSVVETLQCISQAVPTDMKQPREGKVSPSQGKATAGLFQLPYITMDTVKALSKGIPAAGAKEGTPGIKAQTVQELLLLKEEQRKQLLEACLPKEGDVQQKVKEICAMLEHLPQVEVKTCELFVNGEEDIVNFDPALCEVTLVLKRLSHMKEIKKKLASKNGANLVQRFLTDKSFDDDEVVEALKKVCPVPTLKGKASMAETPRFPYPMPEKFYFLWGDVKVNLCYVHACLELGEAEEAGYRSSLMDAFAEMALRAAPQGMVLGERLKGLKQKFGGHMTIRLGHVAPPAGSYDLTLHVMPNSYVSIDAKIEKKIKVLSKSKTPAASEKIPATEKIPAAEKAEAKKAEIEDVDDEAVASSSDEEDGTCCPHPDNEDTDSEDEVFSDFSYDSEDTGTDIEIEDYRLETSSWTIQPKEDEEPKKLK